MTDERLQEIQWRIDMDLSIGHDMGCELIEEIEAMRNENDQLKCVIADMAKCLATRSEADA